MGNFGAAIAKAKGKNDLLRELDIDASAKQFFLVRQTGSQLPPPLMGELPSFATLRKTIENLDDEIAMLPQRFVHDCTTNVDNLKRKRQHAQQEFKEILQFQMQVVAKEEEVNKFDQLMIHVFKVSRGQILEGKDRAAREQLGAKDPEKFIPCDVMKNCFPRWAEAQQLVQIVEKRRDEKLEQKLRSEIAQLIKDAKKENANLMIETFDELLTMEARELAQHASDVL